MDIMKELQKRLGETERRAAEVVGRLEQFDELQRSLADAGRGLGEANTNVSELASAAGAVVDSLNSVLAEFRKAVDLLQAADPVLIGDKLVKIEQQLEGITAKLGTVDELSSEIRSTRIALERLSRRSFIDKIFGRNRET